MPSVPPESAGSSDTSAPTSCGPGCLHQPVTLTVAGPEAHCAHYMGSIVHRCRPGVQLRLLPIRCSGVS